MSNSQRRLVALLILIAIIIAFLPSLLSDSIMQPQSITSYIEKKADEVLALRNWMQKNNITAISLLNNNNRSDGDGISIMVGKLNCFFAGAEDLLNTARIDESAELFNYAYDLAEDAKDYGACAYVRHDDVFEIAFTQNPFTRIIGCKGTSLCYTDKPKQDLETAGFKVSEDLSDGWFKAETQPEPFVINTGSKAFLVIVVIVAVCVARLIVFLLYKKHQCTARVTEKKTEYIGLKSKMWWLIKGIPRSYGRSYTIFRVVFISDKEEELSLYVPESIYHGVNEGERGQLDYRKLGTRIKFIRFAPVEKENETR